MQARVNPSSGSCGAYRRAFTLMEALLAIAITAILMSAMGGVVVTLARATEQGNDVNSRASRSAGALAEIADDVRVSTGINELDSRSISLQVPDRDGDGLEETIRYTWNGTVGKPLERTYNLRPGYTVLPDIRSFSISMPQRSQPTLATSGTMTIFDGTTAPSGATGGSREVGAPGAIAQYIEPVLPDHAVEWTPQSLRVRLSRSGFANGVLLVQILAAGQGGKPMPFVIAQATVSEGSLGIVPTWTTINFASAKTVPAGIPVIVTFTSVNALLVMDPTIPGLTVGAGGGLLGSIGDLLGGVGNVVGGTLNAVLGSLVVSSTDVAYIMTATDPTLSLPSRTFRATDGLNWDPLHTNEQLYLELRGNVTTSTY